MITSLRPILAILLLNSFLFTSVILRAGETAPSASGYVAPALEEQGSWSVVLVPDTQAYEKFARNQPMVDLMTAWIADNVERLNIKLVLCTGDLVEYNNKNDPDGIAADQTGTQQWTALSHAWSRLDGRVPYILATGNHEFDMIDGQRQTRFDEFFPPTRNPLTQEMIRWAGRDENKNLALSNSAYELVSPQGRKFLILVAEYAPRKAVLEWCKSIVESPSYKDHTVILLTHAYLNSNGERIVSESFSPADSNNGQALWEQLVQPSKNVELVICGHIAAADDARGHVGFSTDKNAAGKTVSQMAFNAQALGGGWSGDGGDGWLRILEFHPDGKTVTVRTFSPFFAISPSTRNLAWRREAYDQFTFTLE